MYTKQEEFLAWLAEVKVRESARRRAGARFTHPRSPRHARRLSTSHGSTSHAAPHHSLPFSRPRSTPSLLAAQGVVYEHCGQREIKEHFDSFCEDYNTATMPSKKYYDIQAWHAAEQAKGRKKKVRHAEGGRARTRARAQRLPAVHPHEPTAPRNPPRPHSAAPPPAPGEGGGAHQLRRRGGAPGRDRARPCGAAGVRGQGEALSRARARAQG